MAQRSISPDSADRLERMFNRLRSDIQCILDRDPAARSTWEVLTCYPGLHAVLLHRVAHGWQRATRYWALAATECWK